MDTPRTAALLLAPLLAGLPACSDPTESVDIGEPVVTPDIDPEPVSADFKVTIDPASPALAGTTLEPRPGVATVTGGTEALVLTALVKPVLKRPGLLWVELHIENRSDAALRDVVVTVTGTGGAAEIHDFTNDPFAEPVAPGELELGGITAHGIGRLAIGVADTEISKLGLAVTGTRTSRRATSSSPIIVTPDGAEAWAVVPDGNLVAVIDTGSDERVAQIPIAGRPTSVAVTPDNVFVLVTAADANTVTVIDRATREVIQVFHEAEGIGRDPREIVVSPDGSHAFVSAYVGDKVTSLTRHERGFVVAGSVPVRRRPTGLSVFPDSKTVIVSHFLPEGTTLENLGHVSIIDADELAVKKDVVFKDTLNLDMAKCLADVFDISPIRIVSEGVPSQLFGVFLNPAGTQGWMPGTRVAGQPVLERGPNAQQLGALSLNPGELAPPFIFFLDTRSGDEVEEMLSIGNVERSVSDDYLRCERFGAETEFVSRTLIPGLEDQQVNRFPAFPTGGNGLTELGMVRSIAFTLGGRRALMLSHMSDEIAVFDATSLHPSTQRHFALSGANPTGMALTPDGTRAYVVYDNSTFASVLDLGAYADPDALPAPTYVPYEYRDVPEVPATGGVSSQQMVRYLAGVPDRPAIAELGQVDLLDADPMDPVMRRGRTLFSSSNPDKYPTLTKSRLGTCASCHPNGGNDGTSWGTMEGERRTMSLYGGVAGRGWLHAMGTHRDAHEFADTIVRERLGGALSPKDTDALAQYLAFGIPRLQTPVVDETLAAAGAQVFADKCASCHAGDALTSGRPDPDSDLGGGLESGPTLHDVGTFSKDSHILLGSFFESLFPPLDGMVLAEMRGDRDLGQGDFLQQTLDFRPRPARKASEFKAPSLVNVWDNVVYFHDGRFDDLADVIDHLDETLRLSLGADDKQAVLEYLRTL